jgi:hypothetical protein
MNSIFTRFRTLLISIIGLLGLISLSSNIESEIGKTGLTLKNKEDLNGCFCHYHDEKLRVGIEGPRTIQPGESAEYIVWVDKGTNLAAGFDVAVWAGTLSVKDPATRKAAGDITHSTPKLASVGMDTISWKFTYTAPNTIGTDTLYANGNNVNFEHDTDGDNWNYAPNFVVKIENPTSVEKFENFLSKEPIIYPNPAVHFTTLVLNPSKSAGYDVYIQSLDGKVVRQVMFAENLQKGEHIIQIETTGVPVGMYHVIMQSGLNKYVKLLQIQL